jgi:hypothetical protein
VLQVLLINDRIIAAQEVGEVERELKVVSPATPMNAATLSSVSTGTRSATVSTPAEC